MEEQARTYRQDLYYINESLGGGYRRERVVGRMNFWIHALMFWKYKRHGNVLREPDGL